MEAARKLLRGARAEVQPQQMQAELEQMLRNYRLRRRLELLPGSQAPVDGLAPRWLRQQWRPRSLLPAAGAGDGPGGAEAEAAAAAQRTSELLGEVSELQQRLDRGYSELNAERRAQGALAEGLRRQEGSVGAISAESARLRERLAEVRREVQERVTENGQLSLRLGQRRQTQASGFTQAAILANAVGQLAGEDRGGPASASAPASGRALAELAACRLQIAALAEQREALARRLERLHLAAAARGGIQQDPAPCISASPEACLAAGTRTGEMASGSAGFGTLISHDTSGVEARGIPLTGT